MAATDSALINKIVHETNAYLADTQRADRLWTQVEMHIRASYLAERVGDTHLVPRHLQTASKLMVEANQLQQQINLHLPLSR